MNFRHAIGPTLRGVVLAALGLQGCAQAQPFFIADQLPGAHGFAVPVLRRAPLAPPLRYRVMVIPGSGCAGMAPIADRYFAGLLHAEIWVLHKPGVALDAWPPPDACDDDFVLHDALSTWRDDAVAALQSIGHEGAVPQWLVGISEGGELLPEIAKNLQSIEGVVLLSASGLDPAESGGMQAQRRGRLVDWRALEAMQASNASDSVVVQGRSLRYWRDLWRWTSAQPLIKGNWPLLQVWGEKDDLVPAVAYTQFALRAGGRQAPYCPMPIVDADHGLQAPNHDGVQKVWAFLEAQARENDFEKVCQRFGR